MPLTRTRSTRLIVLFLFLVIVIACRAESPPPGWNLPSARWLEPNLKQALADNIPHTWLLITDEDHWIWEVKDPEGLDLVEILGHVGAEQEIMSFAELVADRIAEQAGYRKFDEVTFEDRSILIAYYRYEQNTRHELIFQISSFTRSDGSLSVLLRMGLSDSTI